MGHYSGKFFLQSDAISWGPSVKSQIRVVISFIFETTINSTTIRSALLSCSPNVPRRSCKFIVTIVNRSGAFTLRYENERLKSVTIIDF
jgi:hypothetical protein